MLNIVSFPAYAKVREFPEKIKEGFMKSLDILFFVLIPVVILLQITGAKLVHIFLGDIWAGITPILKSFSIFFLLNSVADLTYILFNALGLPKKRLQLDFIKIICTLAFMILFTGPYGILGAAIALIIGLLPSLFLSLHELTRATSITYRHIFDTLWVPVLLSSILAVPTIIWRNEIAGLPIPLMICLVIIAALVYCSGTALLGIYGNVGPYGTIQVIMQHVFVKKNKTQ
jgi:O-antigen/teichoic acid export membrane protein